VTVVDSSALTAALVDRGEDGEWARALDAPSVTLDRRLARASGPRCAFVVPT
jgi:predicted nucleic acid-binding protein